MRNYRYELTRQLRCIKLPADAVLCSDLQCRNPVHLQAINNYARDITNASLAAAAAAIPQTCSRQNSGRIPGWSEHVQPLKEKSIFWHRLWMDCDRPRNGVVAETMRRTRAAYHYAIRKIRQDEDAIVRERIAESILNNNDRSFWTEIKRIRSSKAGLSNLVDGHTDVNSIAQLFAVKYRHLYSSVPCDEVELQRLVDKVNALTVNAPITTDCLFKLHEVQTAVSRLKLHKNDGSSGLSSDHFINAGDDCLIHVAFLFSSTVIHGVVADSLLKNTIVSIPKGRNVNLSDSANFRGIALSSVYGKILDNIILERYHDKLMSCDLQFGFKANSSTNTCTMMLKETIAYYVQRQSPVFCTFLDVTKAFDRLHHGKLFNLLLARGLPAPIIRVLIYIYTHNFVRIRWCGALTDYFLAANGVKQGAVLSPVLFCLYVDNLLVLLSSAGFGCFLGTHFVGALAYADDLVLLAPTATALRKMLAICDAYAQDYCITFNVLKTKCLVVLPHSRRALFDRFEDYPFFLNNQAIEFVKSFVHLGHIITSSSDDEEDIRKRRNDFVGQVNSMISYFSNLDSFIRYKLFTSYCTSFYGCELWLLPHRAIEQFCVAWRKGLRMVWKLPYCTHSYLLPLISQCLPVYDEICRRSLNFLRSCVNHKSAVVRFVACHGIKFSIGSSLLGQNVMFCAQRFGCSVNDILQGSTNRIINLSVRQSVDLRMSGSARLLRELLLLRDRVLTLSETNFFSHVELEDIIDSVCTS